MPVCPLQWTFPRCVCVCGVTHAFAQFAADTMNCWPNSWGRGWCIWTRKAKGRRTSFAGWAARSGGPGRIGAIRAGAANGFVSAIRGGRILGGAFTAPGFNELRMVNWQFRMNGGRRPQYRDFLAVCGRGTGRGAISSKVLGINNFHGNMRFFAVFGGITNLVFRLGATACSLIPKGLHPSAQRWPDSERAYAGLHKEDRNPESRDF